MAKFFESTFLKVCLAICFLIAVQHQKHINCLEFNRNFTGVDFSAYVRYVSDTQVPNPDWEKYSVQNLKSMLRVISTRFSKVSTFGVGAKSGPYQKNVTYYEDSYSQVFAAEAAALLNKEGIEPKLTVLVGMWLSTDSTIMDNEVALALESAQKANSIYAGTVPGLAFSTTNGDINFAEITLKQLQTHKQEAVKLNLKLGTRQSCSGVNLLASSQGRSVGNVLREIVKMSDFIICYVGRDPDHLLTFQRNFKEINPNIVVMGESGSIGASSAEEILNMKTYWQMLDEWASKNKFDVWLFAAFDNPWILSAPNQGWWKLKSNDQIDSVNGYLEKISNVTITTTTTTTTVVPTSVISPYPITVSKMGIFSLGDDDSDETSVSKDGEKGPWIFVGIAVGISVAVVIMVQLAAVYIRINRLRDVLSKDEVKMFVYGISKGEKMSTSETYSGNEEMAMEDTTTFMTNKPYDKSLEIAKENLIINWSTILGSGEFGCVYRASLHLSNDDGIQNVDVAVKTAKPQCGKTTLNSLLSEIKILSYLGKHENIVSIQGAYTAEIYKGVVYIATELCSLGSLKNHLRSREDCGAYTHLVELEADDDPEKAETTFSDNNMVRWAYEIACGMEYIGSKHVVHADLATRNVLLTCSKVAKITDFGLSRRLYDYTAYMKSSKEPLPWRWMSIESLRKYTFTKQSDVWSFGVTLWEIFSMGDEPYPGLSWSVNFVADLENGLRMKCPQQASPEISSIMTDCWLKEPQDRPTFSQLKNALYEMVEQDNATK